MAIKGSLAEASLPDVIQLLAYSLKSGCLSVTDGKNFGNIFLKDGKIIYATILNRKERLGDVLVSKNEIDRKILNRALKSQKSEKKRLGEILVEMGAITTEVLERELKNQIAETIFAILTWESGYFNFEADLLPAPEDYTVELSSQELLLEGARRIDEWRKIENKMPPFEVILVRRGDIQNIPLTKEEEMIFQLFDGTRSIDDVLKISDLDFFETCRTVYGLISAGILEKPKKPLERKITLSDLAEIKNLGFAFYKTEMFDEAEREYQKIIELDSDNAEAMLYLGLIALNRLNYQKAKEYFSKALEREKRFSILINLGYLFNKLNCYDEALNCLNQIQESIDENPKVGCNFGIAHFKQGNFDEAVAIFKQVIEKFPEMITPYIYLSAIYVQRGDTERAVDLLNESIGKFPRFGILKNNLAVLYEILNKPEDAEKLYRQAVDTDPHDRSLSKNLADFYYDTEVLGAAKELYERTPEDEMDWQALFKLGNIYLRQGDSKKALTLWEKAADLNPSDEVIARDIEVLRKSAEQ